MRWGYIGSRFSLSALCGPPATSQSLCIQLPAVRRAVSALCGVTAAALFLVVSGRPRVHGSIFCHVTDFSAEQHESGYYPVPNATSAVSVTDYMASGQPFLVKEVSTDWPATEKWSHTHFQRIFHGHALFSSTFSTPEQPQFDDYPNKEIYYGIFLNDRSLAELVANDYQYPQFIPESLRLHGNEWVHWGYPPCGAKRHMDFTCTCRISVQVAGSKRWRLYPVTDSHLLNKTGLTQWNKILRPLEVTLEPGDALVWFPGWEHETGIETGPSISISLHFSLDASRHYLHTFQDLLRNCVSSTCNWNHSMHHEPSDVQTEHKRN